jgi:hypothetical protein
VNPHPEAVLLLITGPAASPLFLVLIRFHFSLFPNESVVADKGDQLSLHIFYEAGVYLAKHIVGLLPRVDKVLQTDAHFPLQEFIKNLT